MSIRTPIGALLSSLAIILIWLAPARAEAGTWTIIFEPGFEQPLVLAAVGDVSGDGVGDLIWRHPTTGEVLIAITSPDESYPLSSITPIHVVTVADLNWDIAGVGDLNGDGREDLVWVNRSTQQIVVWIMRGMTIENSYFMDVILPAPPAGHRWKILAVKDISGNGLADLVWGLE